MPCSRWNKALEETSDSFLSGDDHGAMQETPHSRFGQLSIVDSTLLLRTADQNYRQGLPYSWVLILPKGVTARSDSVTPAPNPAITLPGPDTLPSASARRDLYESKATNPAKRLSQPGGLTKFIGQHTDSSLQRVPDDQRCAARIPLCPKRRPW